MALFRTSKREKTVIFSTLPNQSNLPLFHHPGLFTFSLSLPFLLSLSSIAISELKFRLGRRQIPILIKISPGKKDKSTEQSSFLTSVHVRESCYRSMRALFPSGEWSEGPRREFFLCFNAVILKFLSCSVEN